MNHSNKYKNERKLIMKKTVKATISFVLSLAITLTLNITGLASNNVNIIDNISGTNAFRIQHFDVSDISSSDRNSLISIDDFIIKNTFGKNIHVNINDSILGKLTLNEILEIVNDIKEDNALVTINNTGYANNATFKESNPADNLSTTSPENNLVRQTTYTTYPIVHIFKATSATKLAEDDFIVSVARGQTVTISTQLEFGIDVSYTPSLESSFSALDIVTVQSAIEGSISAHLTLTVFASTTFSGPSESSSYNTRTFRVKFYHRIRDYKSTDILGEVTYRSFWEPMYYVQYSVDSNA